MKNSTQILLSLGCIIGLAASVNFVCTKLLVSECTAQSALQSDITSMQPPLKNLQNARLKRWSDQRSSVCKFPIFFDSLNSERFYANTTTYVLEQSQHDRISYFNFWFKRGKQRRTDDLSENEKQQALRDRSISFLHVGKAGGSTLTCNIRAALPMAYHCPSYSRKNKTVLEFFTGISEKKESAISRQVTCYSHCNENLHCYHNPSILLNMRDPIARISSWYHYEHIENAGFSGSVTEKTCGKQMLFTCYNSLDDLATYGLAGRRPPGTQALKVGTFLTELECQHWAWAAIQGTIPATWHNYYNYEWYTSSVLHAKEIFVLRTEFLEYDWQNLDKMLGGVGATLGDMKTNVAKKKKLPILNNTISTQGRLNICRALCKEMKTYVSTLQKAVNLNASDFQASLNALRSKCPIEVQTNFTFCV